MTEKERDEIKKARGEVVLAKMRKIDRMQELLLQYLGKDADIKNWAHFSYNYARCEEYIEFHKMKRAEIIFDEKCDCLCVKALKRIWVPGSECCSDAMDDIADGLMPNYYLY